MDQSSAGPVKKGSQGFLFQRSVSRLLLMPLSLSQREKVHRDALVAMAFESYDTNGKGALLRFSCNVRCQHSLWRCHIGSIDITGFKDIAVDVFEMTPYDQRAAFNKHSIGAGVLTIEGFNAWLSDHFGKEDAQCIDGLVRLLTEVSPNPKLGLTVHPTLKIFTSTLRSQCSTRRE